MGFLNDIFTAGVGAYQNLTLLGRFLLGLDTLTDGSTVTIDWSVGNNFTVTLGGNRTFAFTNALAGQFIKIRIAQDGAGSRTITWPSGINWPGGVTPTLTTTASKADYIGFQALTTSTFDGFLLSQSH